METKKVVAIWVRVSTDMQGDSPEHHRERAQAYAKLKGWEVRTIYQLEAVSGKSVTNLPEFKEMLADVKRGYISGLIFSKLARVARNTKELLELADYFKEYNADLISLDEALDTTSPAGRFFYTLIAAIGQWEREEIAARVAASVPIRAKLGKPLGGQAPFGYKWHEKKLIVDEQEAPIRKLMFELFAKTKRKKTVAAELNQLGYRTRNGSKFSDTTIDRLIRDPMAKGLRRANYSKSRGEKKHWDLKPATDWVLTECPAIIPEGLWNECNQYLDTQLKKRKKPGRRSEYLLAGFVKCSCGKSMYVFHEAPVYRCKACKNRIEVADIDEIFHEQLKSFLFAEEDTSTYEKQIENSIQEKTSLLESTKIKAQKLEQEMNELVTMRMRKEMTPEDFVRHYQPLKVHVADLEQTISKSQGEIDVLKIHTASSAIVLQDAKDLYTKWPVLPLEDKRSIVEAITEEVLVDKQDITIKLAYLPSHHPSPTNGGTRQHTFMDS